MYYSLALIIGYLIGSIPFAYILLKRTRGQDITKEGTGNVGAMNTYEVTNSKMLGLLVLLLDALKGLIAVYICLLIFPINFIYPAIALFFAVLSHCFNPWLNFKGGRGLAAAAGGAILIFPYLLLMWIVLWLIIYLYRRDIHLANISATLFSIFLVFNTSSIALRYSFPKPDAESTIMLFSASILALIMVKHFEPLKEVLKSNIFKRRRDA